MRRYPIFILLLASCGSDQWFAYDLEPIELARAPIAPGGATLGGLLANVATSAGIQPLLVDSAYPINSFAPAGCAGGGTPGWSKRLCTRPESLASRRSSRRRLP